MKLTSRISVALALGLIACFCAAETTAFAQGFGGPRGSGDRGSRGDGGRGRGGFGRGGFGRSVFGGGGVTFALNRDETRAELGLSEDQIRKLQEASREAMFGGDDNARRELFSKMREADSDEEREKIQEQIRASFDERRKKAEEAIAKSIGSEKMLRLKQLSLQYEGARALRRDDVAADLNITEEQKAKLEDLNNQRRDAFREMGFRASPEERASFDKEWDNKIFAILTPEQKSIWGQKVGRIVTPSGRSGAIGSPGSVRSGGGGSKSVITTDIGSTVIRPDDDGSRRVIASFDAVAETANADAESANKENSPSEVSVQAEPKPAAQSPARPRVIGLGSLPPGASQEEVSFNFQYAPWADVLKKFAKLAGLTLDLVQVPPGTFNYLDQNRYTPLEALDVLNGYLIQKGYTLMRRDQFLVVLNLDTGIPPNLVELVTREQLERRGRFEIMKIRINLKSSITADVAAREAEALLGPQGSLVPLRTSNSLLVTDIGDNLRAISELMDEVTAIPDPNEVVFKQVKVQYIAVEDAEDMIRGQFGLSRVAPNVSAFQGGDRRDSRSSSSQSAPANSGDIKISSDYRTNSLLINAPRSQMDLIESFLAAVDVGETPYDPSSPRRNNKPFLRVYTLQTADAREVAKTLTALLPDGMVINEDGDARRVHILATEEEHAEIAKMIEDLDNSTGDMEVEVLFLSRLDPVGVQQMLGQLFINEGELAPVVQANSFARNIIVRGTHDQVAQIKAVLLKLGEDGTGKLDENQSRGTVRNLALPGRNMQMLLKMLEGQWTQSQPNPIRIVIPSETPNPIKNEVIPTQTSRESAPSVRGGNSAPAGGGTRPQTRDSGSSSDLYEQLLRLQLRNSGTAQETLDANDEPAADPESEQLLQEFDQLFEEADEAPVRKQTFVTPGAGASMPDDVQVYVKGDQLIITSQDEKALDKMEELIKAIGLAMPPETSWTLFYLRTADAAEAAYMLEQLIPDSSVTESSLETESSSLMGNLTAGLLGLGESIADSSGLSSLGRSAMTLRIIPEPRLNALFVSGPAQSVAEVEQFLKILDASELPQSLRDRVPRTIAVEYADVTEVYNDLKEIYAEHMQATPVQGSNPLAALLGGGGNGNSRNGRNQRFEMAKLALTVDEQASKLIVSSNEQLFHQIEDTVKTMDEAARDSRPTMQFVYLEKTDPVMVQQTLTSMLPKVRVAVPGGTPNRTRSTGNGNNNGSGLPGGNGNNGGNDALQQAMQERMRQMQQQRQQGGGQNPGFGGRPGGNFRGGGGGGLQFQGRGGGGPTGGGRRGGGGFGRGR